MEHCRTYQSWKEISKASGYSPTQLRRFEKLGLIIYRKKVGGRNEVWTTQHNLNDFFSLDLAKLRSLYRKEKINVLFRFIEKWGKFVTALLSTLAILPMVRWSVQHPPPEDFIGFEQVIQTEEVLQVTLKTNRGRQETGYKKRPEQKWNLWDRSKITLSYDQNLRFQPANLEYPAVMLCLLRTSENLKLISKDESLVKPAPRDVRLGNGLMRKDLRSDSVPEFVDDGFFMGWTYMFESQTDHIGYLEIYDRKFNPISRIYHPGHLRGSVLFFDFIAMAFSLNARENPAEYYRAALGIVKFYDVLTLPDQQLLPFSEKTIPSPDRRGYYQVAHLPKIQPLFYLAGKPGKNMIRIQVQSAADIEGNFLNIGAEFGIPPQDEGIIAHRVCIDKNLAIKRAYVSEYHVPSEKRSAYYKNFKYQLWNGNDWGPWLGEIRE